MAWSCTFKLISAARLTHTIAPINAQDALGVVLFYSLDSTAVTPVPLDVPHMVSVIDGFMQLRQYEAFQNYAASKRFCV